jgi:predicted PurR-regulated permease PerM
MTASKPLTSTDAPLDPAPLSAQEPPRATIVEASAPVTTRSRSTTGIFILLFLAGLWLGKILLVPIVASVLLSFLFTPVVRWCAGHGIPRAVSAASIILLSLGLLSGGIYSLAGPASVWMERLPAELQHIDVKLRKLRRPVDTVATAAQQVQTLTTTTDSHQVMVTTSPPTLASAVMNTATGLLAGMLITVLSLFFLLSSGNSILDRLVRLVPTLRDVNNSANMMSGSPTTPAPETVLLETERQVAHYLAVTLLINSSMACLLFLGFWSVGFPNPLLWSVVAGLLCFLPYVGAVIGIPLVALVSLVAFDELSKAAIPPMLYVTCIFIEGNLVTPFLLGRSLAMSPIAIFLWLAFWGWIWGAGGALIAVPMLVLVKAFCSRIDNLKPIAHLIEP